MGRGLLCSSGDPRTVFTPARTMTSKSTRSAQQHSRANNPALIHLRSPSCLGKAALSLTHREGGACSFVATKARLNLKWPIPSCCCAAAARRVQRQSWVVRGVCAPGAKAQTTSPWDVGSNVLLSFCALRQAPPAMQRDTTYTTLGTKAVCNLASQEGPPGTADGDELRGCLTLGARKNLRQKR